MNEVGTALRELYSAEEELADEYVKVGERLAAEHDVWYEVSFHDHVHMALLIDDGEFVGTVDRCDLATAVDYRAPHAKTRRSTDGRSTPPPVADALTATDRTSRRRLAVTAVDGALLGLLCLKASGSGFCSDEDVARQPQPHEQRDGAVVVAEPTRDSVARASRAQYDRGMPSTRWPRYARMRLFEIGATE
jgi:hypothetical protein